MKQCYKCRLLKGFKEYSKRKDSSDGYRNTCKKCKSEYSEKWRKGEIKKKMYKDSLGKKQCRECLKIFDVCDFGKSKISKDGLKSRCNQCKRKESAEWRKKNKDYGKEYRKNNLGELLKSGKEYYHKNRESLLAKKKVYAESNKKSIAAQKKRWYEKNKAKVLEGKRRRRDRRANCNENYTRNDERITLRAFDNKCFNCKDEDKLHIDHHRPLSKGHGLSINNAVVLCESCNKSKSTKNPEEFYGTKICTKLDKKLAKLKVRVEKNKGDKK